MGFSKRENDEIKSFELVEHPTQAQSKSLGGGGYGKNIKSLGEICLRNSELEDERIWVLNEDKGLSTKSMYEALCPHAPPPCPHNLIWNLIVPSKVFFFLWELLQDRAPTIDNVIR